MIDEGRKSNDDGRFEGRHSRPLPDGLPSSVVHRPLSYALRVALVSLALAIATWAALAFAPRVDDVVIRAQEPNGSDVALDSHVRITFSRPVDRRSAERSFVLYPPVRGRFSWEGDQTLIFTPSEDLDPQRTYRVTIRPGLLDARGRPNQAETSWPFRTR